MRGFKEGERGFKEGKTCCGTCKHHRHEDIDDGWVCVNPDSEYYTEWTEYRDVCEEWEGRSQE